MSNLARIIISLLVAVGLAATAFMAGYLVNDYVEQRMDVALQATPQFERDLPIFAEAWTRVNESFIGELPDDRAIEYAAIRGSLSELGDPYTVFVEPVVRQQEIDSLRGTFGGIGATLQRNEAGEVVLTPIPGNPAEAAGILAGDVLLAVDGRSIEPEMTIDAVSRLIRGETGTAVSLTVRHPGETQPVQITVIRAVILIPSVSARVLDQAPDIGYIQLTRFSGESANEVAAAIRDLQQTGVRQLILDLRHNGGGLLDAAVAVADHFLDAGPVLYQISRGQSERVFSSTDETVARDLPLVVLIDGGTASAAEIVAGALQDYGRATLIGSRTFGKGSVQLVYDLSDGSSVHVTSARWLTPDRHQIDQQGLEPNFAVTATQDDIDNGRDVALDQAVLFLRSMAGGRSSP